VIGIDVDIRPHNRRAIEAHPLAHKIKLIEGSSISPEIVTAVRQRAVKYSRILVSLDSNHTHDHVLAELEAYAPIVSLGSYCVVFDTVIENLPDGLYSDRPWAPGNSPMTAVHRFLSRLASENIPAADGEQLCFEIDSRIDSKLLITVAPGGYLRRVRMTC
jgi:cephalosporin hydroxylase